MPGSDVLYEDVRQFVADTSQSAQLNVSNIPSLIDELYNRVGNVEHAEQNGHLDATASEQLNTAIKSSNALQKAAAGVGVAVALSATAGLFAQAAQQMDRLPGPFRNTARPFRVAQHRIEQAMHTLASVISHDMADMMHHHLVVHSWATKTIQHGSEAVGKPVLPPQPGGPQPAPHPTISTQKVQAEVDTLKRQVAALSYALGIEQHTGAVPRQVWDQIHALQRDVAGLKRQVASVSTETRANGAAIDSVQRQLESLAHQISGVAAVTTTWPDVLTAINQHITTTTHLYNHAEEQIHANAQQIASLAPLGLLLQPGARGLRTLRQLEDTPCMCPKVDTSHGVRGELLGWYEFITNG